MATVTVRFGAMRSMSGSLRNLLLSAIMFVTAPVSASDGTSAPADVVHYDPVQTFAPLALLPQPNRYRSASGVPGPDYWQNRADYEIHARLSPETKQLAASEVITYTNYSPDALASLWLQLDQNTYKRDARSVAADTERHGGFTDGIAIDALAVEYRGKQETAEYLISDTRMQIRLPRPLTGHGGKLRVHIRYHYLIPGSFGGRTSWVSTENGEIYNVAQWYPRMAVYDDVRGWDTLPFLGEEFYLEYGTFDYYITVPSGMVVAGSGQLVNAEAVMTASQRRRMELARVSDATVMIRTAAEVMDAPNPGQQSAAQTWHFRMANSRDVAFAVSRVFIWDAARIRLPEGQYALAMSFYPIEGAGEHAWGRSTEYVKHAVEELSRRWSAYPYPAAVNVAGGVSGMEYPALVFVGLKLKDKELFAITVHEIGHTWFPMMVGFDERRHAWMDEGFNTFIDTYESEAFAGGIYGPKRDIEFAPGGGNPFDEIVPILTDPKAPPPATRADSVRDHYGHPVSYFKSALGLVLLREQILGPQRFDWAFRHFIRAWSFRHPQPADFFRAMDSEAGEDLSWFWRGWYLNNWTLDLAVKSVDYLGGDPRKGAEVTIENLDRLVLPAIVEIVFTDGTKTRIHLPAETWIRKNATTLHLDSSQPVATVTVDPDHVLPEKNRSNNVLIVQPH
jgi:peptidase M1-like protein